MVVRPVVYRREPIQLFPNEGQGNTSHEQNDCSSTIETNEMTARFIARADGTGATELFAELLIPGDLIPENVNVSGGDRLIAKRIDPNTLEEREKLMIEHSDFDTNYGAGFRIDDKQTGFEIAFDRSASGRVSASDSSVTLPSPFALDWVSDPVAMTPAPQSFSRSSATPYFVVWDPFGAPEFEPSDALNYQVTGKCILTLSGVIDWQGGEDALELTGALEDLAPPRDGRSCPIRVRITLQRDGTVDSAFSDGSFVGEQVRVLKLQSVP